VPGVALGIVVPFGMLPLIFNVGGCLVQEAPAASHLCAHLMFELALDWRFAIDLVLDNNVNFSQKASIFS
jgi:hypothetical protein